METAILILKDALEQREQQLRDAYKAQKQHSESIIINNTILNLIIVIADLTQAIFQLRRALTETSDDNGTLPIPVLIQRSEQLINFFKWLNKLEELKYTEKGIMFYVDKYLKSINCV